MAISGVSPEGDAIPELDVTPLVDSETDLEDELPTPDDSPFISDSSPDRFCLPGARPAPPDVIDFELEKALLNVSILPVIVDPLVGLPGAPSAYPEPPLPVLPNDDPDPVSRISPSLDVFPPYTMSPACTVYDLDISPTSPSVREDDAYRPPSSPATMDQYLSREGDLLLGDSTDLPLLAMPQTPRPIIEDMVLGSSMGSPAGESVAAPSHGMPDLSWEGPFDVYQDASESTAQT